MNSGVAAPRAGAVAAPPADLPAVAPAAAPAIGSGGWSGGLSYGLLGLPLAFVALPLYVQLPHHYAGNYGLSLGLLGALLLGARLADALVDPLLGRWCDRLQARSATAVLAAGGAAAAVLALGLTALYLPPVRGEEALAVWFTVALMLTCAAWSLLTIAHQAWGARLGGGEAARSRVVAWREGAGLVGVVLASVLPALAGVPVMLAVFALALAAGWLLWTRGPRPPVAAPALGADPWRPWRLPAFRRLLAVFVVNGIASAVPATLVLFFVQDRLQAPTAAASGFLALYFVAAAAGMPLWLRVVERLGLARAWLTGMVLSVASFAGAALLGPGDLGGFALVCALSGLALGADLALPAALLAGVIADHGDRGRQDGAYFGWWAFAGKLNLALAAGLALPLLGLWGYAPGVRSAQALDALGLAYAVLPCVLKLLAAAALYGLVIRPLPDRRTP